MLHLYERSKQTSFQTSGLSLLKSSDPQRPRNQKQHPTYYATIAGLLYLIRTATQRRVPLP